MTYLLPSYSDIDLGKPCLSTTSHDLKQWWCQCRQEGPVTFTWRQFHKEYPQPSETKIILNITYLIFIQVCRGSMSKLNIYIGSGNYRLWNGAFLSETDPRIAVIIAILTYLWLSRWLAQCLMIDVYLHGWAITIGVINSFRFCARETCLLETWKNIYICICLYDIK